jgi:hypothetical protein
MSLTGCEGGAVALPGTAEGGAGVVGVVFAGAGGAVAMHKAVLHMIIRITIVIILFKAITTVWQWEINVQKSFILSYI